MELQNVLFNLTAALVLFCAVRVVTAQRIFRSALYLAVTLSLLAVLYLIMHAEFVALVQILVYVGAVIILIIFAVMLTAQLGDANVSQSNRLVLPGILGCGLVFYGLARVIRSTPWLAAPAAAAVETGAPQSNLQAIGHALLESYVYPFEMIALILFTALVGAVLIARKDPE